MIEIVVQVTFGEEFLPLSFDKTLCINLIDKFFSDKQITSSKSRKLLSYYKNLLKCFPWKSEFQALCLDFLMYHFLPSFRESHKWGESHPIIAMILLLQISPLFLSFTATFADLIFSRSFWISFASITYKKLHAIRTLKRF